MDNKMPKTSSTFNCCRTKFYEDSSEFYWGIHNFVLSSFTHCIESSIFSTKNDCEWKITLIPKKICDDRYTSIFLDLVNCKDENVRISCMLSIIKNDASKYSRFFSHCYASKNSRKGFEYFIKYHDLINNDFLKDDTLYIKCKIKWYKEDYKCYLQGVPDLDMEEIDEGLSRIMSFFINDESFSDVSLKVDDVTFRVHKVILAARSSVFAAMFEHEMKETKEDVVKIKEMEPEIVKEMLRFIYTGRVEGLEEKAIELLKAADMYDLNELKLKCEITICKSLATDNVDKILHIANIYNAENLKKKVMNFMKDKM